MELRPGEVDALTTYLSYYDPLIGDRRTQVLFQGIIKGIIGVESLVWAQIGAKSPEVAARPNSAQRIRPMARQKTTRRSSLDAESVTGRLRQRSLEQLQDENEIGVLVKATKECLGWEEVQLLKMGAVRTLVALAWVAAGFLYELGVTFEDAEVRFLTRLGGWEERKDRRLGKIILMRGLRRLLDMAAAEAILADEIETYGHLPPRLAAMLGRPPN